MKGQRREAIAATTGDSPSAHCGGLHANPAAFHHPSNSISAITDTLKPTTRNSPTYGLPGASYFYIASRLSSRGNGDTVADDHSWSITHAMTDPKGAPNGDAVAIGYQHTVSDYCPGYPDGFD